MRRGPHDASRRLRTMKQQKNDWAQVNLERVWLAPERMHLSLPVANCSAASRLPPDGRPSMIHLITLSTRHTQHLQGCWLQWVSHVLTTDATTTRHYRVHLRTFDAANLSADGLSRSSQLANARKAAGSFKTAAWYRALRAKMVLIKDFMDEQKDTADENDVFVVTDLDVAPLRPYSNLLPCLEYEATFMREPPNYSGRLGSHVVNGGFYVFRNTPNVRAFLANMVAKGNMFPRLHDQDIANAILLRSVRHSLEKPALNWGVFPRALVTGQLEDVNEQTVAYHAIGAENTTHKTARLAGAFQQSGTSLPNCRTLALRT